MEGRKEGRKEANEKARKVGQGDINIYRKRDRERRRYGMFVYVVLLELSLRVWKVGKELPVVFGDYRPCRHGIFLFIY